MGLRDIRPPGTDAAIFWLYKTTIKLRVGQGIVWGVSVAEHQALIDKEGRRYIRILYRFLKEKRREKYIIRRRLKKCHADGLAE